MEWATQRVQNGLLTPLARRQSSRFSRSRPPPAERRVRILQTSTTRDAKGGAYVPFAVDVRFGSDWQDDIVGCVYQGSGKIFVKIGDDYRPAAFLLGKKADPVPSVCEPAARS